MGEMKKWVKKVVFSLGNWFFWSNVVLWVTLGDLDGSETIIGCFCEDKGGVVVIGE